MLIIARSIHMRRYAFALFASIFFTTMSSTVNAWQITSTTKSPETEASEEIPVLHLTPAAEPTPALRYRFWPDRMKLRPGNAMVRFQRAGILRTENASANTQEAKQFWDQWNLWIEMPLAELPIEEVRDSLKNFQPVLRELHAGRLARDSYYDLPVEQIRGLETIELLLPEFQGMRSLARILQLEIRLAIIEGRIDDAIQALQTGFRLGEATGQANDYLVVRLIGFAISGIMLGEVENLMQAENCPNLYWALASLPSSTSEIVESLQFEASIMSRIFNSLEDLPGEGEEPEVWEQMALDILGDMQQLQSYGYDQQENTETKSRLLAAVAIVALSDYSRTRLLKSGWEEKSVAAISPAEAVVRATALSLQEIQDNFAKWTYLPAGIRGDYLGTAEKTLDTLGKNGQPLGDLSVIMARLVLPAMQTANAASLRTQQSIARLATIEAIRHHVSRTGAVPDKLQQLDALPAWPDPFTEKAISYEKLGPKSAKLIGAPRWNGDTENMVILSFE